MNWLQRIMRFAGPTALCAGIVMLAACGSTATASNAAGATATCPTNPGGAGAATAVTGTISALSSGSFTVTASTGKTTVVQYSTTTRFTHLQTIPATSLTAGTNVTILTQPAQANGTAVAQTIIVQTNAAGNGTPGAGTGGFGQGAGGGTRGGSFPNANCFRRGNGTPRAGGANNPGFRGLTGTVSSYNAGTQQLTVTDTQGATFLVTISATTTIGTASQGTQADLQQGATVTVRGTLNGTSLVARQIQVFTASQ